MMLNEQKEFAEALEKFILAELRNDMGDADYCNDSIQIVDARNHFFRNVGKCGTDEEAHIYVIRDLCCPDEVSLATVPDRRHLEKIARECGLSDS